MIETICETILRWREMGMPPETRKEHLNSLAVGIEHLGDGNPTSMRNAADRVSRASCFGIGCSPELKKD